MFDFLMAIFFEHTRFGEKVLDNSAAAAQKQRRKDWVRSRLWHNGAHRKCCPRCFQAGYVMALLRTGRLDLLAEYPELVMVYEDLVRDGYIKTEAPPFRARAEQRVPATTYRM